MNTQEYEMVCVWNGTIGHDVYLGALKGVEPFYAKPATAVTLPVITKTASIPDLVVQALRRAPMTQSQLASACNRSASDTRRALRRLAARGLVELQQASLFAMEPHDGQLWRVT